MIESRIVEAACGECQFTMPGQGCDLAVRMDGQCYFVDGVGIDDHGDAHAHYGLCNTVRKARVSGEVREGRFVATAFELLPVMFGRPLRGFHRILALGETVAHPNYLCTSGLLERQQRGDGTSAFVAA